MPPVNLFTEDHTFMLADCKALLFCQPRGGPSLSGKAREAAPCGRGSFNIGFLNEFRYILCTYLDFEKRNGINEDHRARGARDL